MRTLRYLDFLFAIFKAKLSLKKIPLVVGLNVTNRCNLQCAYCYGSYSRRTDADFSNQELLELIEELAIMGTRLIHLGGGEPLMRADIADIIDKIKSKNMLCFMNTNGLLIPDRIKEIRSLDALTISLDGDEHANDSSRGQGSFKKIIKAIDIARAEGLRLSTNTVINRNNLNSLDTIISLAKAKDFTAEFNLPYEQASKNKISDISNLSDNEVEAVLRKLIALEKNGAPLSFSVTSREYALSWPLPYSQKIIYDNYPTAFRIIKCYMGHFMCLIDSDGLVYPCGQLLGKFPALNIREVGFKKAWASLIENRPCKACYCICFTEFNQLFGLRPAMLFSTANRFFRKYKKGKKAAIQ
jgi:AdoMet-dependent heme synthase